MNDVAKTKACGVCSEQVPDTAKFCTHCNHYLDWRRWLSMSQTTLSLLVALVSVIGAMGPAIVQAFRADNSKVKATFQSFVGGKVLMIVSNTGARAGNVANPHFQVNVAEGRNAKSTVRIPLSASKAGDYYIAPNQTVGLELGAALGDLKLIPTALEKGQQLQCFVSMDLVQFDNLPDAFGAQVYCIDAIEALWGDDGKKLLDKLYPPIPPHQGP